MEQTVIDYIPNRDWLLLKPEANLHFPVLRHITCNSLDLPFDEHYINYQSFVNNLYGDILRLGGSYNCYSNLDLYHERCALFENHFWPYNIDTAYFHVRNAILLMPNLNMSLYTYLEDPQRVFLKKDGKFVAEIRFSKNFIIIYEVKIVKKNE